MVAAIAVAAASVGASRNVEVLRYGVKFGEDFIDQAPTGPSVGDYLVVHDTVVEGSRTVGSDAGVCTFTSLKPQVASCVITFRLPRGQMAVQFANTPPPHKRAAIVGGTGRYHGARGELRILEHPDQTGG
ncbi:MAG: hypothetical protein M3312_03345 [Actinomycetota bacterium]|nr:hypothetical protein [Actinomycetota bacterium]